MLNDHCHRVSTHLQSINIIIKYKLFWTFFILMIPAAVTFIMCVNISDWKHRYTLFWTPYVSCCRPDIEIQYIYRFTQTGVEQFH